jgi:hypothetical protein
MASIKLKGDTSGEVTISAPSVAGTTTLELPATSSTLATQNSLGVRNLIINGNMQIAQRGTSSAGITTTGYYTIDRWSTSYANSSATWTNSQDSDVPTGQGFANSFKILCTTSSAVGTNERLMVGQRFEGQMLQHLKKGTANAESLTLSFWVKSNKTGTYIANLFDTDNSRSISKAYTINTANTWEKKTLTFDGDTTGALDNDNAQSFVLWLALAVGTFETSGTLQTSWGSNVATDRFVGQVNLGDTISNYINITGVQLEVGTEATPFEHRPYDMELARCQRYYEQIQPASNYQMLASGFVTATTNGAFCLLYSIKRTAPSFTFTAGNTFSINNGADVATLVTAIGINAGRIGTQSANVHASVASGLTVGNGCLLNAGATPASCSISISAEL